MAKTLSVTYVGGNRDDDVALLKIKGNNKPSDLPHFCYNPGVTPPGDQVPLTEKIYAFGFKAAVDDSASSVDGEIVGIADDNRWIVNFKFSDWLLGGPVFNDDGFMIGVVEGQKGEETLVTPLRWAKTEIQNKTSAKPACFRFCRSPQHKIEGYEVEKDWEHHQNLDPNDANYCQLLADEYKPNTIFRINPYWWTMPRRDGFRRRPLLASHMTTVAMVRYASTPFMRKQGRRFVVWTNEWRKRPSVV